MTTMILDSLYITLLYLRGNNLLVMISLNLPVLSSRRMTKSSHSSLISKALTGFRQSLTYVRHAIDDLNS